MVNYPDIALNINLPFITGDHEQDRGRLRQLIIDEFIRERPGTGLGDLASKYRYIVEQLSTGDRIYLTRPAFLNKGFDFIIHVEGLTFLRRGDVPKHEDIFKDLRIKKDFSTDDFQILANGIERIYHCEDSNRVLHEFFPKNHIQ